ncbi:MAG TPA: DUF4395 domain-containing protein [Acidimicrobiales bacterium]|nr:DUF4395 domain-containing protein [Acidimicrobiales bacterium]
MERVVVPAPGTGGAAAQRPRGRAGSLASLVGFPDRVNDIAARAVATGVVLTVVVALATRQAWVAALLAYGFVARTASGPRFSLLGQLATRVVAPRLPAHEKIVPGPPKRFAQAIGAAFTLAATACWLAGDTRATFVLLAVLAVPALLEASLGLCVGCKAFALLMRAGVIPDSTCEACADLWGPAASRRRAARAG